MPDSENLVKLAEQLCRAGRTRLEIARQLGVSMQTLSNWKKRYGWPMWARSSKTRGPASCDACAHREKCTATFCYCEENRDWDPPEVLNDPYRPRRLLGVRQGTLLLGR